MRFLIDPSPQLAMSHSQQLVGLIASSVVWDEVLVNVFAEEVSGIDCVLETETQIYTYTVNRGKAIFK